jgi:hypothetical protein
MLVFVASPQSTKYKVDLIIISLKINLFSPWYSWKIAELVLNNNHSLFLNSHVLNGICYLLLQSCGRFYNIINIYSIYRCRLGYGTDYHGENKLIFNEMMMRSTLYFVLCGEATNTNIYNTLTSLHWSIICQYWIRIMVTL